MKNYFIKKALSSIKISKEISLILIFLIIPFCLSAQPNISLKMKDKKISSVIEKIEASSEYNFFYNSQLVDVSKSISLDVNDANIEVVLNKMFGASDISYKIEGKDIILSTKKDKQATKKKITGTIIDEQNYPVIGASIRIVGVPEGTTTDIDGKYSLNVELGQEIEVSFLGYNKRRIKIGSENIYDLRLTEDSKMLDEVVVVGYGVQRKSDLTGAIGSVKTKDLPKSATSSVEHMLAGQVAGLQVRANDAQPGGGLEILIRGAASVGAGNAPLYVIDGFPVGGVEDPGTGSSQYKTSEKARSPLNSINPNDIESIEILKDASATSIYGARAANGVILITTKKGKKGRVVVNYDTKFGVQSMKNDWKLMNASQLMGTEEMYKKEQWMKNNNISPYGNANPSTVSPYVPTYTSEKILAAGKGTDWLKEVTRTGIVQEHNINVSGATDQTSHLVSVNYYNQDGIVKENNFTRITARVNISQEIKKWLKVGINATGSKIKFVNAALGEGGNENSGVIEAARIFTPTLPVRNENGEFTNIPNSAFFPNPVSLLDINSRTTQNRIFAQTYVEIMPIEGMVLRGQFGVDKQDANTKTYVPKTTLYGKQKNGQGFINHANRFDKMFNTTISYTRTFNEMHTLTGLLGYEWQRLATDGYDMKASNFPTDAIWGTDAMHSGQDRPTIGSFRRTVDFASYFARANYNMGDKYLATVTIRADGSDKFGADNRWGYFPSGSLAWRIVQEEFMKNLEFISNAKFRLGIGQTGNSNIGENAFAYYRIGGDRDYLFGGNVNSGAYMSQYGNSKLKWETTTEYNIGLDLGFLKNRINVEFDFYSKEIKDLLGKKDLPYYLPLSQVSANIGKTSSKGFELNINTVNLTGQFKWNTSLNLSHYKDKWKERSPYVVLGKHQSVKDPLRPIWGYELGGILQPGQEVPSYMGNAKPGAQIVVDRAGLDANGNVVMGADGKIGDEDRILLGTQDPDLIYGLTNTFEYKGFDLNIHLYGFLGWKKYNTYLRSGLDMHPHIGRGQNFSAIDMSDHWSSENLSGTKPNLFINEGQAYARDQFVTEKADFLKVRNITLGYTFSNLKSINKYFSNLRLYVDAGNPFLWTKFTKIDPEYTGSYPSSRTWTFGLNVQF